VEAPGTAPGSATLIPNSVYRHSRQADIPNIVIPASNLKDQFYFFENNVLKCFFNLKVAMMNLADFGNTSRKGPADHRPLS